MELNSTNTSAVRHHLRQLTTIRYIALGGQTLALLIFAFTYPIEHLPIKILGSITLIFFILNTLTLWRTRRSQSISEQEFFGHLILDIIGLSVLLYFSGGATNPFISYFLVPISIAAATLSRNLAWLVTGLAFMAYSLLLIFYFPIPDLLPNLHSQGLNLHIIGMWANFIISASLITYFVFTMAAQMRLQEQQLSLQREEQLQDEQILGVAALAAGAAHELSTPLNTMKLLIDDSRTHLANEASRLEPKELDRDLATLQQQIERCRKTLKKLVQAASIVDDVNDARTVLDYVESVIEKWRIIRPTAELKSQIDNSDPDIAAYFHPTIEQALHNLLNNAADASEKIELNIHWDPGALFFTIRDFGPGIDPATLADLGKPVRSGKPHGLGLGLFLSYSTLTRHGGEVSFSNIDEKNGPGGTLTEIILPLRETL